MERLGDTQAVRGATITWQSSMSGRHRIALGGDVDPADATRYRRLGTLAMDAATAVEVDLAHVGVFGSWAVEATEHLRDLAARSEVDFRLVQIPRHVERVLTAIGYSPAGPIDVTDRAASPASSSTATFIDRPDFERIVSQAALRGRDAMVITTADLERPGPRIVFVNRAFTDLTGYSADEVLGQTPRILQGELTDRRVLDRMADSLRAGAPFRGETVNYRADHTPFVMSWEINEVTGDSPRARYHAATQTDVTDLRRRARFETALTYLDSRWAWIAASGLVGRPRAEAILQALVHAHVSLIGGGHASARLVRHGGDTVFASTATTGMDVERGRRLLAEEAAATTTTRESRRGRASLVFTVPPQPGVGFFSGRVALHGVHRDRIALGDPHLHERLTNHGLGGRL